MLRASSTDFPLTRSTTNLILRGDVGIYLLIALASIDKNQVVAAGVLAAAGGAAPSAGLTSSFL